MEQIEFAVLHAIACARRSIRVVTPYFLPPDLLTTALGLAAMRGVTVDIVVPENRTMRVLDWARRAPLRVLLEAGCRVWLMPPPFDHSKLMTIDDAWSLIGSANWDIRSFRLNFELNVEIQDEAFARTLAEVASKRTAAHPGRSRQRIRCRSGCATTPRACCSLSLSSCTRLWRTLAERRADLHQTAAGALQRVAVHPRLGNLQVEHDRLVVRRSEIERAGEGAGEAVRQAAVEAKGHDVAAEMRRPRAGRHRRSRGSGSGRPHCSRR